MLIYLACTPSQGNEKGRVERQVQIDREQFFTPIPKADNLKELKDILTSRLITYNNRHRHPEYKNKTIEEVYQEENSYLVPTPVLFDGYKEIDVKISTTCLARFENIGNVYLIVFFFRKNEIIRNKKNIW